MQNEPLREPDDAPHASESMLHEVVLRLPVAESTPMPPVADPAQESDEEDEKPGVQKPRREYLDPAVVWREREALPPETTTDLYDRPRRRLDCIQGEHAQRPCPFVGCENHLYLSARTYGRRDGTSARSTEAILYYAHHDPDEDVVDVLKRMPSTCGLDRHDGLTLEEAGARIGVTRERTRQIEAMALKKLRFAGITLRCLTGDAAAAMDTETDRMAWELDLPRVRRETPPVAEPPATPRPPPADPEVAALMRRAAPMLDPRTYAQRRTTREAATRASQARDRLTSRRAERLAPDAAPAARRNDDEGPSPRGDEWFLDSAEEPEPLDLEGMDLSAEPEEHEERVATAVAAPKRKGRPPGSRKRIESAAPKRPARTKRELAETPRAAPVRAPTLPPPTFALPLSQPAPPAAPPSREAAMVAFYQETRSYAEVLARFGGSRAALRKLLAAQGVPKGWRAPADRGE